MPIQLIYITSLLLLIGAAPIPFYGYYNLLRIIAFITFTYAVVCTYSQKNTTLPWIYGLLAILFNPIIKIYLPKEIWSVIDIAAAILLISNSKYLNNLNKTNDETH